MPIEEHPGPPSPPSTTFARRGQAMALLAAIAIALLVVGIFLARDDDQLTASTPTANPNDPAMTTVPTVAERTEILIRLQEILAIRDRAILTRNADLLDGIYTVDCKCLEDGRGLIQQLRKERIVWKGVRTRIVVEETDEVNDRLWTVVATVTTPSVRIETESGRLVRVVPPERNLVRFGLARSLNGEEWLLGHASTFG
jgi:hypothetical protein